MAVAGRLAFVTGGGSGIGRTTCQILAREGASVVVADKRSQQVEETIELISKSSNTDHLGLELDVGVSDTVTTALRKIIEKYSKPPTIVVNSAGITRDNFMVKMSEEDFDQVINVNLKGTFLVTQIMANSIIEHGLRNASVINISSIVKNGNIGQTNYSASKAGVIGLTKSASKEFGKLGIRVNAVVPGFFLTPMFATVPEKVKEGFLRGISLARFGNPEEVAEVIAFLASDKSSYVTGAVIEVTGGF